jgi:3-deoxy-manno-octulosonate cytidylyltransferase (CMP-KDO synthetase)
VDQPVLGVIPARLGSTRLQRKPLQPVLGKPLLQWVWERVVTMSLFEKVVVATDSSEVMDLCSAIGAEALLTDAGHASGTDRVAEVVNQSGYRDFPLIVNVQGDEPLVEEYHLRAALDMVREQGGWQFGTCAAPLVTIEAWRSPDVVKVVRAAGGSALLFSRAPIPAPRGRLPTDDELAREPFLRHIGVYAYTRAGLLDWVSTEPSPLELLERLEQLRILEKGGSIGVALVRAAAPGVDTAEDIARMEELLSATSLQDTPLHPHL